MKRLGWPVKSKEEMEGEEMDKAYAKVDELMKLKRKPEEAESSSVPEKKQRTTEWIREPQQEKYSLYQDLKVFILIWSIFEIIQIDRYDRYLKLIRIDI